MDVYCLPGTMCDHRLWASTQRAIGTSIKLIHCAIPMENTLDAMVEALANRLPKEPFDLLGFSMGGYLACAFAIKYPERVQRLMVLSNTATGLLESERKQREVALNWVSSQGYRGIPKKKAQAMLGKRHKDNTDLLALIQAMDTTLGEAVLIQQLTSSLDRPSLLSELEQTHFPICVSVGEEDELMPASALSHLNHSDRYEVRVAADCGHMLPIEQPKWLADVLVQFYSGGCVTR